MEDNEVCRVELQLDSSCDSVENQRGETGDGVLLEAGELGVDSPAEKARILNGDLKADRVQSYTVYDDDCYQSETEEWRSKNKFVSLEDAPGELLQERQCLLGQLDNITEDFLATVNSIRAGRMLDVPQHAPSDGLEPMTLSEDLSEIAKAVWMERTSIPDGFIAIPDCIIRNANHLLGCLLFCTPKTDEMSIRWLGRQAAYFWSSDGRKAEFALKSVLNVGNAGRISLKQCMYYPSGTESYAANQEFERSQRLEIFSDQLYLSECRSLGIYADMVLVSNCCNDGDEAIAQDKNLACFVAVFHTPVLQENPGVELPLDEQFDSEDAGSDETE